MKIVDLSLDIHPGMMTYPTHWHPKVDFTPMGSVPVEGRATTKITLGTHTGTHMDAPAHFIANGSTIDQVPLELFIGEAVLINLTGIGRKNVEVADIRGPLERSPNIKRVVLRHDWSKKFGTSEYYASYPYLSRDAARYLADHGVRLIAMDTPSPDNPKDGRQSAEDSPVHKIFLSAGIILVEYLTNLDQLSGEVVDLYVLPLKLKGVDGSPVRCLAVEKPRRS